MSNHKNANWDALDALDEEGNAEVSDLGDWNVPDDFEDNSDLDNFVNENSDWMFD